MPRIADEVIIAYMDNDIDKPFISGSLYNTTNPSLIHNPLDSHKTSLSSRTINLTNIRNSSDSLNQADSSQTEHSNTTNTKDLNTANLIEPNIIEQGYNELTLSNLKDNEEISLKAQKDYNEYIKHNFSQTIHNNKDSKVKGSYTESITKYHKQEILGLKDVRVGAEYLTNVALSKDTIVGLSHTLNIGASNTLRVANDSNEVVGGDKEVEIGNNLSSSVGGDRVENVRGNSVEAGGGGGTLDIQSTKEINISIQSHINVNAIDNILFFGKESASFETQKELSFIADNTDMESKSHLTATAGNQILHQVGDTQIIAKGDSVIIKAGGVEVVIDSNGLVVKGGEVKSEWEYALYNLYNRRYRLIYYS